MINNLKAISTRMVGTRATSALEVAYRYLKGFSFSSSRIGRSQSNEALLLDQMTQSLTLPQTFCEFGFDITQFNCGLLARRGWEGLLIDGHAQRVKIAQHVLARDKTLRVAAINVFLDASNVSQTIAAHFQDRALGVLSIDVDGNDYWLLKALLPKRPSLVVVEYNASLGLRSLTVPYDPTFDRHIKHSSGWYHGASLTALDTLCSAHGFSLVAVSEAGLNAFFARSESIPSGVVALQAQQVYRENTLRNRWSNTNAEQQWAAIRDLPYVEV